MENLNIIRKIAWSFHRTTGVEYKELFSEASLFYCEAVRKYNPDSNVKLTTFVTTAIQTRLIDYLWNARKRPLKITKIKDQRTEGFNAMDEIELLQLNSNKALFVQNVKTYQPTPFSEFYDELPKLCRELVDVIFEVHERIPVGSTPAQARGIIVKILLEKGWKHKKIWDSIRQMKNEV